MAGLALVAIVAVTVLIVATAVATFGAGAVIGAALVGAVAGVGGRYVADVISNIASAAIKGEKLSLNVLKPSSSLAQYGVAAFSGALSGVTSLIPGAPLAKKALNAVVSPLMNQSINVLTGKQEKINGGKLLADSAVRFGTSFLQSPMGGNDPAITSFSGATSNEICDLAFPTHIIKTCSL